MTGLTQADLASARESIGRQESREQMLDSESLRRFSAAIGCEDAIEAQQPALGYWAWFLPTPRDAEIGRDGHPSRGGFLPAIDALPRRMFASTTILFEAPLLLDILAQATRTVTNVSHKAGHTGDLVFVEIERRIVQCGRVSVVEHQTIVYRAASQGDTAMALPQPTADAGVGDAVWTPNAVNLFRFSAVTFNGHRIHYDLPYTMQEEGYPALIVHGPFIAARLAERAAREGALGSFEFRARAPCFVDQPIRLQRTSDTEFHAVRCDGEIASTAKVSYR